MIKISLIFLLALSIYPAYPQQIPWGEMKLKSPDYNENDSTVILRIEAPHAKNVMVDGDFTKGHPLPLHQHTNGIWSVNIGKIPSDLYTYHFIVDGVKVNDPSNAYVVRDNNILENIVIIPGEKGSRYEVSDVPHGSVTTTWYESAKLGSPRRLVIYTPTGYEKDPDKRFPVLYLLHGLGGDETSWSGKGRISQILDNLIASGSVEPMIVVMPNGNSPQQAAPGENREGMFVQPTSKLPFEGGAFESSFPEIVSFIDSNYRTLSDKAHRAIAGLSMGGMHSRAISMNNPGMFDYVALFSPAIDPMFGDVHSIYDHKQHKLQEQYRQSPTLYWIGIGKNDFLYDVNTANRALMDSLGLKYDYHESGGGHTWSNWRDYLCIILPKLFNKKVNIHSK